MFRLPSGTHQLSGLFYGTAYIFTIVLIILMFGPDAINPGEINEECFLSTNKYVKTLRQQKKLTFAELEAFELANAGMFMII
jgi:hypothetical protein